MRVVILSDNAGMGGVNRYCLLLYEELKRREVDVRLACLSESSEGWLFTASRKAGIPVDVVEYRSVPRTISNLRDYLSRVNPSILHVQGYRSSIVGHVAAAGLGLKTVRTVHGMLPHLTLNLAVYDWMDRITWRCTDRVIAVSAQLKSQLTALGIQPEKVSVVRNGIRFGEPISRPSRAPVVGWVGRLSPEKGTSEFAEIMRRLSCECSEVRFLVVGDGPERASLETFVSTHELEHRVTFCGEVSDTSSVYGAMDIMVMPSKIEGLPFALIEGMASGVAVVANAVGGVPEVISHGHNGLLVTPGDSERFVMSVLQLLRDEELRSSIAMNACRYVRRVFSADQMAESTIKVYLS